MQHQILLVDDDSNVISALRRALRREPYTILSADSGQHALDVLERAPVDLVVADHDMPGMSGVEFITRVATLYPDTVRFMLTGRPTLDIAVRAINQGSIGRFFTKPADPLDLTVSIRQALQQKDLMTEAFKLLQRYKQQNAVLEHLERQNPGITQLNKDDSGSIVIEEASPGDYDTLIDSLRRALDQT